MIFPELSEIVNELTVRYRTRRVAKWAGVSPSMIRKVARSEAGLDTRRVASLSRELIRRKNDRSLVSLFDTDVELLPQTDGSLDDEVLDMSEASVEARRAFEHRDHLSASRHLARIMDVGRRMTAEIRRLAQ